MLDFRPFRAWCPRPELAGRVASPPYDVLEDEEARTMIEKEPLCFLRVEKAEALLAPAEPDRVERAGREARQSLERLVAGGVLQQLKQPGYFAYRMEGRGRTQTGLAGLAGCREWREGRLLRHEQTRADKVAGREANILGTGSHNGPVLLASRHGSGLGDVLRKLMPAEPLLSVDDQAGVRHSLWPLGGESHAGVSAWLAGQDRFLIADGHHRAEAACRVWEALQRTRPRLAERASAFLAVVFPAEELRLLGYHRLVRLGTPAPCLGALPEKLAALLQPAQIDAAPRPGEPVVIIGEKRFRLRLVPGDEEGAAASADARRLQRQVLGPLFGVEDPRTDPRLSFLGGEEAAGKMRDLCAADHGCVGFLLHPPALDLVFRVAAQGGLMPPKSTWFEPKLRSGILVNRFEE